MNAQKSVKGKGMDKLRAHPFVADVEAEGCDEARFFVHLHDRYTFTWDPCYVTHSQSFTSVREALRAVRGAELAERWPRARA